MSSSRAFSNNSGAQSTDRSAARRLLRLAAVKRLRAEEQSSVNALGGASKSAGSVRRRAPGTICFPNSEAIDFAASERFRMLRAKIERLNSVEMRYQVIAVCSAVPREGKSLIAVNLARSLASAESRVLLLDCDLRKPTVHTYFKLGRGPGVSDLVLCKHVDDLPIHTVEPGLDVLTAGHMYEDGVDIIRRPECKRYVGFLRKAYRYIVVDMPPAVLCSDPIELASLADGILFVVRTWRSKKHLVKEAITALGKRNILGVVVNDEEISARDYAAYGYYYDGSGVKAEGQNRVRRPRLTYTPTPAANTQATTSRSAGVPHLGPIQGAGQIQGAAADSTLQRSSR